MHSFANVRKNDKQSTLTQPNFPVNVVQRDFQTQLVSQHILNEILQKAEQIHTRNIKFNGLVQTEKLKQSQDFAINNCGQVLQNFFIEHQCLSPKMINEQNLGSPSKSPYSFLNYEQMAQQSERNSTVDRRQMWEKRRDSSKIHNCNKIYIVKRTPSKRSSTQKTFSIKSIKLNQTLPSGFGARLSDKSSLKRLSINNSALIPRLSSRGRLTVNPFNSTLNSESKRKFLQLDKTLMLRSSFYEQKHQQKQSERQKLIKLENQSKLTLENNQGKQKQTNDYISFLRERKEKLQNIMKVFDLDDLLKKNHKIQRENLMRQNKTQNLAQTYSKMPSMTTDYDGNPVYINEPTSKHIGTQPKSLKKSYIRLPRYQAHEQGAPSHNISFKVKDIDDKTKNFLNQIFSSACGTPSKNNKKIAFNMKNLELKQKNNDKYMRKQQRNFSSKISINYEEKKPDDQKRIYEPSIKEVDTTNNSNILKTNLDQSKGIKPALKIPLKSVGKVLRNSLHQDDKENIQIARNLLNSKSSDPVNSNKLKGISKTEQSHRLNAKNENSFAQLEMLCRQGYSLKKQRIHPHLSKIKKLTTKSSEGYQQNKIIEVSKQTTERTNIQSDNQPLKTFFDMFLNQSLK